jgi:hypothetical protein
MTFSSMKRTIIIILTLISLQAFATGQEGELIIYKGDTLQMMSEPLEAYLSANEPRERFYPFLKDGCSTALWRGYVGLWEYRESGLYLIDIYACGQKSNSIKKAVFKNNDGAILASWFSGKLFIEKGKMIKYNHSGYDRIYEKEFVIEIEEGEIKNVETHDNGVKPSDKGFSRDPDDILGKIYQSINWDNIPKLSKDLKLFSTFQIGDNGELINIEIKGELGEAYKTELSKALNSFPPIQVLYSRGQPAHEGWTMMIVFSGQSKRKYAR